MSEPIAAAPEEGHDPFDYFDRIMGADTVHDPYPDFAKLRERGGIVEVDPVSTFGESAKAMEGLDLKVFMAVTHEAVKQVLIDGKTFSSQGYAATMGQVMGPTILAMDEPEHSRYRSLIQTAFTRRALERWETALVAPIVHRFVDAFRGRGRADLVRELTFPFPVHVIAGMLGLPHEDLQRFHRWTVELISVGFAPERGMAASRALADYLTPKIEARRREPADDLISVLAQAELDGVRLDDAHILGFLRLLLPAGAETTYRSSSNLLFGLLSNPDQLEALRSDRTLLPAAIEEGLRWETPLTSIGRFCTRDVELFGAKIPAGSPVSVNLGAANRDPARWQDPDAFDIRRPERQHMSFAFGAHRCLGMHLARMETRVVLEAVLDRLPDVRLDPEAHDIHITGRIFRSPRGLPVVFDP